MRSPLLTDRRFSLNWTYLDGIANGQSAIDLGALALRNRTDAEQFAREYGYDLSQGGVRDYVQRIQQEALAFVQGTFLTPEQQVLVPAAVAHPEDPLDLLLLASQRTHCFNPERLWACALLKVMHGLFYIDNNLKLRHFAAIRQQVFEGLDAVIRTEGDQAYLTDGLLWLPLVHLDRKRNKGRHSILLKLLQKPEYVAADIHDHLGVRLTLATRIECLLALELLRRAHIVSVINLEASRTRNTLLDLPAAKAVFTRYKALLDRAPGYPREVIDRMEAELLATAHEQHRTENPHSGSGFNSLQVTVRKMIHLPANAITPLPGEASVGDEGVSFFFAYEVQLMDAASHDRSLKGPASHEAYKQRQIETARARVFGPEFERWVRVQAERG
ncbi:TIGR04552 family protein [Inhella gelatinilytica]|uniref:TIGR04552 family protein n=1 Tax=Inhella gelatinilytica TaxID=2795030 RepID=UPI001FE87C24|nr:TIGR04552 family protein [Inhella gelatinilytica]